MEQIIINNKTNSVSSASKALQNVSSGNFFDIFINSKKQSDSKPHGLSAKDITNLRIETIDILNHCNPHNAVENQETTHLVVGYVQSGKTMSFTALTALALDNQYRMIIYLAGTKNNLLNQTAKRLRKDLVGIDGKCRNRYKIHTNPTIDNLDDIIGHIESSDKPIILMPILKHYDHINKLTTMFKSYDFNNVMDNETVMIIDDEADQASLNSYGRKNSKNQESEMSRTYEAILQLRSVLPGNTFIQYTATPQANILISMQDMLSPKSHTLLTPGEGYIGGKLFFGKGPNRDLYNGELIIEIPEDQVFHKKKNPLKSMPESLKDALMIHILAVAIVVKYYQVEGVNFLSMMVHPDNTKKWNKIFKVWIENELTQWRKSLRKKDGHIDKTRILNRFEELLPLALEHYDKNEWPKFNDIKQYIIDVLNDKKVYLVNTDIDAETDLEWNDYKMHILVGAEMLNRGFTIENLATTYMPRYTTGASNADTIQQRCRFFGYKQDYIKSCRVFLPKSSIINYMTYIEHEEELRSTLKSCDTLASAERKILLSPRLKPTRSNVLPIWVVNSKLKGMHGLQAFASKSTIESNNRLVDDFIQRHKNDFIVCNEYTTADRTHRWFKLEINEAIQFISDFNFKNWPDAQRKADTIRYLRYLSASDRENSLSYVYFYQMAFNAPARKRSFDSVKNRLAEKTDIFAGPSSASDSTNYPGDRNIIGGPETITIQLHHIEFKGTPLDFPKTGYTLAVYYPKELAVNYCTNEKNNIDDSDEESEDEEI